MNIYLILLSFFVFITIPFKCYSLDTKAEQAVVIEFDTNEILFEKNAEESTPPASMTKIMTVYAAFDRIKNTNLEITNTCRISSKAYKMGGSRTFLEIDDSVSIDDLLKGIIIQSGNDASVALAECLGGTEEDFVKLMNFYAAKLGMKNTNFTNSSGWPEPNHYSSAHDLAILSNSLIRDFPDLYPYFSVKNFTYNDIKQPNRNHLLGKLEGTDGLKTGYTKKSGWGIAATAIRNERRITAVINGTSSSRSRTNEASNLMAKLTDPNTDFDKPQTEKARAFVRRLANAWIAADESHRQGVLTDNTYELLRDDVQMVLLTYPSIQPFVNEFLGFYPTSRGLLGYAGEVLKEANPL